MKRTIYKNARILDGTGKIIEQGVLVVEHAQKDFVPPEEGGTPVKTVPAVADKIAFLGDVAAFAASPYAAHAASLVEEKRSSINSKAFVEDSNPEIPDSIVAVTAGTATIPEDGTEIIDVRGYTLMPGLVCADTRLDTLHPAADDYVDNIGIAYRTYISYRNAAEALNTGVTTLRAEGMPNNIDIALKNAITKTMFFGPTVLATGPVYGVTGGRGHTRYGMIQADGIDALRGQMRIHISRGLEGVVLQLSGDRLPELQGEYRQEMSTAELQALTRHAKGAGKKVSVNASGDPSVTAALDAGADCIQQGYRIGEANLARMAAQGVYYIPCLVSTLGADIEAEHRAVAAAAVRAGVNIILGTEVLPSEPVDGTTAVIREMELLCEAGLSPAEVLMAATAGAAAACGTKAGILKEGGRADFLIIDGRPDEDITAMRRILAVVKDGRRAFNRIDGAGERQFHIHAPGFEVVGGTTNNWCEGALQGVREPANFNTEWNLVKEI